MRHNPGNILFMLMELNCSSCPIGANCTKTITALPNYLGYNGQFNMVAMIRCPDDYCCQGDETCKGIDSCNTYRTGPLCGKCRANWTESLFSPECLLIEICPAAGILVLYVACAIIYGLGLMVFNYIKDVGPSVFQKIFSALKKTWRCDNGKQNSPENTGELERLKSESASKTTCISGKEATVKHRSKISRQESTIQNVQVLHADKGKQIENEDDAIKYAQILFYYIQDSVLFKVRLPGQGHQDESIVIKILQFSPEVLITLYAHVSDLCFSPGTTAVTKLLFSFFFGPCVMIFIYSLYLGQTFLSYISSKSRRMFKARLVQTFLLVLLFSYQRMVIGAFTLIQCVDIGNSTVLYIQGDVECYTWWQNAVEVYIVLNIVSVLFVLSHTPFCIENKQMSVKMFIVGCLLPVPVMLIYYIQMFVTMRMHRISLRSKSQTPFGSCSLSEQTVVPEQFETRITPNHDWNVKVDEFFQKDEKSSEVDSGSYTSIGTLGQVYVRTDSDTDIGSEYSTDLIRVKHDESTGSDETMSQRVVNQNNRKTKERKNKSKFNDSREAITYTLLKDYRCLEVFRVRFTWLGIHKLYRVWLVACNTYITDPLFYMFSLNNK